LATPHRWLTSGKEHGEVSMSQERTPERERARPTGEVGDEGGSPGDVELERSSVDTGSEATSTVEPTDESITEIRRDESGIGRRSP
jgi:hypothetical protein